MPFEKEDNEAIVTEIARLDDEIRGLKRHRFKFGNGKPVRVKFVLHKTMFDGKCVNTLVGNSATTRCPMCLKTCHQFGNSSIDFSPNERSLYFGLGLLHAEINAFEHLLHLSYRLRLKQWDVRENLQGNFIFE